MREDGAGVYAHTLTQTDMQVTTERLLKGNINSRMFIPSFMKMMQTGSK